MPVLVFGDGRVEAGRVLVCRSCSSTIRMSLNTLGRPEQDAREHILVTMDRALHASAEILGWANIDELNRADCPRHQVG